MKRTLPSLLILGLIMLATIGYLATRSNYSSSVLHASPLTQAPTSEDPAYNAEMEQQSDAERAADWTGVVKHTTAAIALAKTPDGKAAAYYWQGLGYKNLGNYPAAESSLRECLKTKADAMPHLALGMVLEAESKDTEALNELDQAIKLSPDLGPAYAVRAKIHNRQGNRNQALADINQALKIAPGYKPYEEIKASIK